MSRERYFYDDETFAPTFPQAKAPTRGLVTMTQVAKDYANGAYTYQTTEKKTYDEYSRVRKAYDGNGNVADTSYTMNSVGLSTGSTTASPLSHTTSMITSPMRGTVLSTTDINGVVARQQSDALGRTTAVWMNNRPMTAPANYKFSYTVSKTGITAATTEVANGYIRSVLLYDALLRPRQTQAVTPQGGRMITDTLYDTHGWVIASYNGWWDSKTLPTVGAPVVAGDLKTKVPNQTFTTYDGLGRAVIVESAKDNRIVSKTTTVYQGDRTTVIPPAGGTATSTVIDPLGRNQTLTEYKVHPVAVAPVEAFTGSFGLQLPTGDNALTSTFEYNERGNQHKIIDPESNPWTSTFNLLGQVTSKDDPTAGSVTNMKYDGNGNLLESTDSRGKTTSSAFDALNRQTGTYAAAHAARNSSNQLTALVYDNANAAMTSNTGYVKGQLTTASTFVGGQEYKLQSRGFDVFGNSLGQTVTLPASEGALAGSYAVAHTYSTNNGLLLRDVFPAKGGLPSETVLRGYDGFDKADTLNGAARYGQGVTYDAYGRVNQQTVGSAPNLAYVTNTYDEHTGQLTDQLVTRTPTTAAKVHQQKYEYDLTGNVIRQTTDRLATGLTETQCFTYDGLRRLTEAWTATDNCAVAPTDANRTMVGNTIGGGSAYWTSWAFNDLGNRTSQIERSLTSGGTDTTTAYHYDGNGKNQPNTLTSTATTGGRTGSTSYTYDSAGNTETRTTAGGTHNLAWNESGKLSTVTTPAGTSTNIYNHTGDLLLEKNPGTTTLYLGTQQFVLSTSNNMVTGSRYYALPGGGSVVRNGSGSNYTFAFTDLHSTPDLYLDSTAQTPNWRQYTPYGERRGATITIPDNRGFLNKTLNSTTGLVQVGARQYDTSIGRFISLDPIFDGANPQSWNGYAYSNNNPTTMSDPTGLRTDENEPSYQREIRESKKSKTKTRSTTTTTPGGGGGGGGGTRGNISGGSSTQGCGSPNACDQRLEPLQDHRRQVLRIAYDTSTSYCQAQGGACYIAQENLDAGYDPGLVFASMNCGYYSGGANFSLGSCMKESGHFQGAVDPEVATAVIGAMAGAALVGRRPPVELPCSFTADTLVLLADGSAKPISELKTGDVVIATNPVNGTHAAEEVTATHRNRDDNLVDLYVLTDTGPTVIYTTDNHPFWSASREQWLYPVDLRTGEQLQTSNGTEVTVVEVQRVSGVQWMYNLTVDTLHTYYVLAGSTPVRGSFAGQDDRPEVARR